MQTFPTQDIAIVIPCLNEEQTIGQVIADFHAQLPKAKVYVIDNNSSDKTSQVARAAGAEVLLETFPGKGNVLRNVYRRIAADVYVFVDGDQTYPADRVEDLVAPIIGGQADMVVGDRQSNSSYSKENKRRMHSFGNRLVCGLISLLYKQKMHDVMSGYRAVSKSFLQNTPLLASGFEVETEITLHALDKKYRIQEIPVKYHDRPPGSASKLKTFSDGLLVLKTIASLAKHYKPLFFFTWVAALVALAGLLVGAPVISEYFQHGYIYKIPSAILAASIEVVAFILFCCGMILDTVVQLHREQYYISINNRITP